MQQKILVTVGTYEAAAGLAAVAVAVSQAAANVSTAEGAKGLEETQGLAMGAETLARVVTALQGTDGQPVAAIHAYEVHWLRKAMMLNGGSPDAVEAREKAAAILTELEADIRAQKGEDEDAPGPTGDPEDADGFVIVPTLGGAK